MHMLGHDYVSDQPEAIPAAHDFKCPHKHVARLRVGEEWVAVIATESYKMELAGLLIALQSPGHGGRLSWSVVVSLLRLNISSVTIPPLLLAISPATHPTAFPRK